MIKIQHLILNREGMHTKPATVLVSTARKYCSDIILWNGKEYADMKNLMEVMRLGVRQNTLIEIELSGEDEAEAAKEFEKIVSAL